MMSFAKHYKIIILYFFVLTLLIVIGPNSTRMVALAKPVSSLFVSVGSIWPVFLLSIKIKNHWKLFLLFCSPNMYNLTLLFPFALLNINYFSQKLVRPVNKFLSVSKRASRKVLTLPVIWNLMCSVVLVFFCLNIVFLFLANLNKYS